MQRCIIQRIVKLQHSPRDSFNPTDALKRLELQEDIRKQQQADAAPTVVDASRAKNVVTGDLPTLRVCMTIDPTPYSLSASLKPFCIPLLSPISQGFLLASDPRVFLPKVPAFLLLRPVPGW